MSEVILLGDPVVYRDDIKGFDDVGIVTCSCINNFQVLWNGETYSRTEIYNRLRPARLDEVDEHCRVVREES
ncbi:phosphohistidine phosphatase [Acinetobacter modestus]|uniref:phosphohistidine phosphatase n=1 Tax=Acinetobacter modestus TaxID=1776740 RepID=UPI003019952A